MKKILLGLFIVIAFVGFGCNLTDKGSVIHDKGIPVPILYGRMSTSNGMAPLSTRSTPVVKSAMMTRAVLPGSSSLSPGLLVDASLYGAGTAVPWNASMDRFIFPLVFCGFTTAQSTNNGDVLHYNIIEDSEGSTIPVSVLVSVDEDGVVTYTGTFDGVDNYSGFTLVLNTDNTWTYVYRLYFRLVDNASSPTMSSDFYTWSELSGTVDLEAETTIGLGRSGYICSTTISQPVVLAFENIHLNQNGLTTTVGVTRYYWASVPESQDILNVRASEAYEFYFNGLVDNTYPRAGVIDFSMYPLGMYPVVITPSGVSEGLF